MNLENQIVTGLSWRLLGAIRHSLVAVAIAHSMAAAVAQTLAAPIGWATVPAMGRDGTTGGGDGDVVVAHTAEALKEFAERAEPLTILVEGTLRGGGRINVAPDKSIIGLGATATLEGTELSLKRVSNVIIRNLTIRDSVDAIALRESHHVWVDHCDLTACTDGLLDITHGSDYVTVSWTRFSNHRKTFLINSGTSQPEDAGTLRTTIHHCWFDGSATRNPRVGYAQVHLFNSLYNDNNYGLGLHSRAKVLAEQNVFKNVKSPIQQMYRDEPSSPHHGFCESRGNVFQNLSAEQVCEGISFSANRRYRYDFAVDPAVDVPQIVRAGAGPAESFGKSIPLPLPGQGAVDVSTQPDLRWTRGVGATSYKVAFGSSIPPDPVIETKRRAYAPGRLRPGTVYYWRVDQVTANGLVQGDVWQFETTPARAWLARPVNGATSGTTEAALGWRPGADATAHRVYLARTDEPLKLAAELDRSDYMAGDLDSGTSYRWRIDTMTENGVVQGDEWKFTTRELLKAGPGRVEAESMTLEGDYFIEAVGDASGGLMAASNGRSGSLLYSHQGDDGLYDITLSYFNGMGSSQMRLHVDGELISEWTTREVSSGERYITHTSPTVRIRNGAKIRVTASWQHGDDLARVDWVQTRPVAE